MIRSHVLRFTRKALMSFYIISFIGLFSGISLIAANYVDEVENLSDYTFDYASSAGTFIQLRSSGDQGLTAQAGSYFISMTGGSTTLQSGTITYNSGFGTNLVQAGTYVLTINVGEGNIGRYTYSTFQGFLQTTNGNVRFSDPSVDVAYVDPRTPDTASWQQIQISYTIENGDPLIGEEFTWSADWTLVDSPNSFYGAFDDVNVEFSATGDVTPPTITQLSPENEAKFIGVDSHLVMTFTEAITTNSTFDIVLTNITDGTTLHFPAAGSVVPNGNVLTINPYSNLDEQSTYAILIDTNSIIDLYGNFFAGISNITTWTFTTRATPYIVDDFEDDVLNNEWKKSRVLSTGAGATVTFDTTTNDGELTWSFTGGTTAAQQDVLLRDDVLIENTGDFIQTKVKLTGAYSTSVFMGVAIHQTSCEPTSRTGLISMLSDGSGKVKIQIDGGEAIGPNVDTKEYVYLRLALVTATSIQASYSTDGIEFTNVSTPITITGVKGVGFYTGNARSTALGTAIADYFAIYPPLPSGGTVLIIQ